jgi:YgiT-type zinc finger domain-containing protein
VIWTATGKCPCGGTYEDRKVDVRFTRRESGEVTVLDSVPQGACPICGSRVYHASMLYRIESTFKANQLASDRTP